MTVTAPASTSATLSSSAHATLCRAFQATAARHPERVALRTPGDAVRLTWGAYADRVRVTAARLAALGVGRGDTVALLLTNRPEAAWVDAAAMHLGAVGVSVYLAGTPAAHAYVLDDAEAKVLVTEQRLAGLVPALRRACPKLEHVLGVDGDAPGVTPLDDVAPDPGFDVAAAAAAARPADPVAFMYTSGTTGAPKGVAYTHGALVAAFACLRAALPPVDDLATVAFIPFAHAGQRAMVHYRAMTEGTTTTFCADPESLPAVIADARPSSLFAPPAVWQRLAAGLHAAIETDPDAARRALTEEAHARALERVRLRRAGGPAVAPSPEHAQLLEAARARLGLDRMAEPVVSAAPSPPELLEDLHASGVAVMNLYALTELPPITVTRPDPIDIGTAGRPLPGVDVRLGRDGEVLVRHPAASSGYHRRPAQTAALFDRDGWGHTGDVGTLDHEGRLSLHGRRDERFATALGTNIDPVRIETALKAECPLVAQACVIGDGRPHLVALLTVQPEATDAGGEIAAAVERVNERLPATARVRRHLVLGDTWAPGSDELTPTLKLRRNAVHARYAEEIEGLYETD
jgi:long-chain acyl-CoA synthetase